jgi:hypothetical protein
VKHRSAFCWACGTRKSVARAAPLPSSRASEAETRQGGAVGASRIVLEKGEAARRASPERSTRRSQLKLGRRRGAETRPSTCVQKLRRELPVMPWMVGKSPLEGQTMILVTCAWAARARPSKFSFTCGSLAFTLLGRAAQVGDRPDRAFRADERFPKANGRLYRVASAFGKFSELCCLWATVWQAPFWHGEASLTADIHCESRARGSGRGAVRG